MQTEGPFFKYMLQLVSIQLISLHVLNILKFPDVQDVTLLGVELKQPLV